MNLSVNKNFKSLNGIIEIPSDKSISHRAVLFSSLSKGISVIKNFSKGADPHSSLEICRQLGAEITEKENTIYVNKPINLSDLNNLTLNCGNSGTTMRLTAGILAGNRGTYTLQGDNSLNSRPMKRIIEPLCLMGADINSENYHAPIKITGSELQSINYKSNIASAQVKSCILLAGLFANGKTICTEPYLSRNHTEIMLKSMGANIEVSGLSVSIEKSQLSPLNIEICGDISSAAYFLTAGLIVPNSEIIIKNVGINPTRTGILEVIKNMGGNIEILEEKEICGEIAADIKVKYSPDLKGIEIKGEIIPALIDEIPIIALLATQADGKTVIKDAQDLKNKETDRITTTVNELKKLGANIEATNDGMIIYGKTNLSGNVEVNSYKDHRLAMTLYAAGLITQKEISVIDFDWVKISFPEFEYLFDKIKV